GDAERACDIVGAAKWQHPDWYRIVLHMFENIGDGAVTSGGDNKVGCVFQCILDPIFFGRDVIDLEVGEVQGIDDAVLVVALSSGRWIVYEERPHGALTARLRPGSGTATICAGSRRSIDERVATKQREAVRGSARLPAVQMGLLSQFSRRRQNGGGDLTGFTVLLDTSVTFRTHHECPLPQRRHCGRFPESR